jgi:hypothetical protein
VTEYGETLETYHATPTEFRFQKKDIKFFASVDDRISMKIETLGSSSEAATAAAGAALLEVVEAVVVPSSSKEGWWWWFSASARCRCSHRPSRGRARGVGRSIFWKIAFQLSAQQSIQPSNGGKKPHFNLPFNL